MLKLLLSAGALAEFSALRGRPQAQAWLSSLSLPIFRVILFSSLQVPWQTPRPSESTLRRRPFWGSSASPLTPCPPA